MKLNPSHAPRRSTDPPSGEVFSPFVNRIHPFSAQVSGFTLVIPRILSYGRPPAAGHVGKSVRVATMSDGSTIG